MVSLKETAFLWSLIVLIFAVDIASIKVALSTDLTSTFISSVETTATVKGEGALSAKHLEPNTYISGLKDWCQNGGSSVYKDGSNYCVCRKGTSGDTCEVVEECARNPSKCGNEPDARCIYNITKESAECQCIDTTKKFDSYHKICRDTCRSRLNCFDYEECTVNRGSSLKFCRCPWGKGGLKCSGDIDECKRIGRDCGNNSNVECLEGKRKEPVCYCHGNWTLAFNYEVKDCVKCDCGESGLGCRFFPGGEKLCFCAPNYYQKDGKCEACNCGYGSNGCKSKNGKKVCDCWSSFIPVNGTCQNCKCGSAAYGCKIKNRIKVCDCSRGYFQVDGICKECRCGYNEVCSFDENRGKVCTCKSGYDLLNGVCSACDCGNNSNGCSFQNGQKSCSCKSDYIQSNGACKKCDCGNNSNGCSFQNGQKSCSCKSDFIQFNGTCKKQCGVWPSNQCENGGKCMDSVCQCLSGTRGDRCEIIDECLNSWDMYRKCGDNYERNGVECAFNQTSGTAFCRCKNRNHLFDEYDKQCKECNCGRHGNCTFFESKKMCKCEKGWYIRPWLINSRCEPCKCGPHSTECQHTYSFNEKECFCDAGYALTHNECMECSCGPHGNCSFDVQGEKICKCQSGYVDKNGFCVECSCGIYGHCSFDVRGKKVCKCQSGYADENGFCVECDSFWDGLGVNYTSPNGRQKCTCPKGYEEKKENYCSDIDECKDPLICPIRTDCKNTLGSYECPCRKGYRPHSDEHATKRYGCTDIDECEELNKCSHRDTMTCIDTEGSYYCECKDGYSPKSSSISIEVEGCVKDQTSWRVGVIIFIVVGVILIGSVFVICKRRSSSKKVFV